MSPFGRRDQPSSGGRSAADREAARLERERRRAEREGRPLPAGSDPDPQIPQQQAISEPAPLDVGSDPVVAPAPAWEPDPQPGGPVESVSDGLDGHTAEPEPEPEPEPVYEPEPARWTREPEPVYAAAPPPLPPQDPEPHGDESPAGVRRVGAPSVRDLPQVAGPQPSRKPPKPPKPRGVPKHPRRWAGRIVGVLILLVIAAIAWFAWHLFQPGHGSGDAKSAVRITVAPGATASDIGDELAAKGVIDSKFFFNLRARVEGKRGNLKAGTFTLKRNMSYAAVLDALTKNPAAPPVIHVTIPEGRSIAEAAPLVRQSGLTGSYLKAAARNPRTIKGFRTIGVPRGTRTLEGFLFPATYELKRGKGATASALVGEQLASFRDNLRKVDLRAAQRKNLTAYDIVIIASMIEREAQVPKDRALISAVIYNRLKQHIPLGIDATLRYALKNWSRPLRVSELRSNSAFNTRNHQGLPPTPIGSPGLASLQAAANPARVPYLYYVVKPCGNGAHAFSSTDAQFQRDVAAYNKKRAQLGGKDPSHCK